MLPLLAWDRVDVGYISEHRLSLMIKTFVRLGWLDKPFDVSDFLYDVDHLSDEEVWLESHAWQLLGAILFVLLVLAALSLRYARKVLRHKTAELVASEAMWRHFVDIADIGIFIHSQGKILFANTYMLERMGMTAEGVIGVEVAKHIHSNDLLLVAQRVQDIMEHDAVIRGELVRYISASGEMFDVEISSLRILFNGDLAVLGVARDITAKKCAEAALKASEAQYRQLVECSPDAVLVHQGGAWCFANSAGLKLMGAKVMDELLGKPILESVHPNYHKIVAERMKKELFEGEPVPLIEERFIRLDGTAFWAEVTGIPVQYKAASASLLIVRDITDRTQATIQLRQEKRKMSIILDHAPIGIWMSDLNGSIQLINKAFTDAMGISEETFVAAYAYVDLLPKDMAVSCSASDQACIQSKQKVVTQEYIPCVDGKVHVFDIIKAPVLDDEGGVLGVVGLSIDASERMEAEAEKERMQHQVEHTQRLESLGVLAGGVAHDFNNILATILGNASLIQCKLPTDTDVSLHLQRIVMASEKASLLCSQMLAYAGQGQIAVRSLNMTDLSRSIASLLEVSIGAGVDLSYDLDANLPMVDADEAQMQQLVMNLVINASEAMDGMNAGHIALKTSMKKILPEDLQAAVGEPDVRLVDDYVCLQVSDDGCGMDADVLGRIFEPFFTTKFTGRGLGMSALLGIVRAHKGCLSVRSKKGEGTRFRVFLPVGQMLFMPKKDVEPVLLVPSNAMGTVLVIDDDEMIRETVVMMLEDFGYEALVAEDGAAGVEVYRQHQADIQAVLLDVTMPKMNGLQCFKLLKEMNADVKVFLSSGYQEQQTLQGLGDIDLAGYIQKPYRPEVLEEMLIAALLPKSL
ncbi:MAG: PAS domain S-box protein [Mariprofundaceae bacterium]|nr:PAS domain S-box protein [Mariprofundaceae bacterium]